MKSHSHPTPFLRAACAATLLGLAALPAAAQLNPTPTLPPGNPSLDPNPPGETFPNNSAMPMPNPDAERFISKVSMLNSEEARLSTIATQRTANEQLRSFARQVRKSSEQREQELSQLAQTRSVLIPTGKDANDMMKENEDWQEKDADDFDEDFVKRVIDLHEDAIDALEDYADDNDSDPELAAYARKHLPELRQSLSQAQNLEDRVD